MFVSPRGGAPSKRTEREKAHIGRQPHSIGALSCDGRFFLFQCGFQYATAWPGQCGTSSTCSNRGISIHLMPSAHRPYIELIYVPRAAVMPFVNERFGIRRCSNVGEGAEGDGMMSPRWIGTCINFFIHEFLSAFKLTFAIPPFFYLISE